MKMPIVSSDVLLGVGSNRAAREWQRLRICRRNKAAGGVPKMSAPLMTEAHAYTPMRENCGPGGIACLARKRSRLINPSKGRRKKKIHGAVASAAERCGICEKSSLAGLQILAGTPPRVWAL